MPLAMGTPLGAYGPVRYDSTGMNCSLACAWTAAGRRAAMAAARAVAARTRDRSFICLSPVVGGVRGVGNRWRDGGSMRERPEPQLLLAGGPEAGQAVRLHDK